MAQNKQFQPTSIAGLYPGIVIDNIYSLTDCLDRTAISNVWKAVNLLTGEEVAMKFSEGKLYIEWLQNEKDILSANYHPMFPKALGYGQYGNAQYLVMDIIPGITLRALIKRQERIPIFKAIEITIQVLYGLNALHQNRKVHRDVKPGNIMTNLGKTWLLDFGLTCDTGTRQEDGTIVGTPLYMPPEQAQNEEADPGSDIYSAGHVLREMITKDNPMKCDSNPKDVTQTIDNQINKKLPPIPFETMEERFKVNGDNGLRTKIESLHHQLNLIIDMMAEKDLKSRLGDVEELVFHLGNLQKAARELFPYEKIL
jgi:serine/threonine protein kinase